MKQTKLIIRQLNIQCYSDVAKAMHTFTDNRAETTPDEVWLVQHPAVYTLGQTGKIEHLIQATDIPVIQTDRGGQITYHGPGQQILYPLISLRRQQITVRQLVTVLEQTVIQTLASLKITAYARQDAPGVYVDEKKICSLGLRIRKGCSLHGLALNIAMDLQPFNNINPCGYAGLVMTQIKQFVPDITADQVQSILLPHFIQLLGYQDVEYSHWRITDYD